MPAGIDSRMPSHHALESPYSWHPESWPIVHSLALPGWRTRSLERSPLHAATAVARLLSTRFHPPSSLPPYGPLSPNPHRSARPASPSASRPGRVHPDWLAIRIHTATLVACVPATAPSAY